MEWVNRRNPIRHRPVWTTIRRRRAAREPGGPELSETQFGTTFRDFKAARRWNQGSINRIPRRIDERVREGIGRGGEPLVVLGQGQRYPSRPSQNVLLGIIVGLTAVEFGFAALEFIVMSAIVFAGAPQLAAVYLMADSIHILSSC